MSLHVLIIRVNTAFPGKEACNVGPSDTHFDSILNSAVPGGERNGARGRNFVIHVDEDGSGGTYEEAELCEVRLLPGAVVNAGRRDFGGDAPEGTVGTEVADF